MSSTVRMEVRLFTSMTSEMMGQRGSLPEALALTVTVVNADTGSLTRHRFPASSQSRSGIQLPILKGLS